MACLPLVLLAAVTSLLTPRFVAAGESPTEAPADPPGDRGATSAADDGSTTDSSDQPWVFGNPFARTYRSGPGLVGIGLHVGSIHRDGIGPRLTVVPWDYLRVIASYGYRTDHSLAAMVSVPALPRAALTPYATVGYALAIAALPQGIRLFSHQLVAGIGLEARVASRYLLGAELTGNGIVTQILKDKLNSSELAPGDPFTIQGGFHFGVNLP